MVSQETCLIPRQKGTHTFEYQKTIVINQGRVKSTECTVVVLLYFENRAERIFDEFAAFLNQLIYFVSYFLLHSTLPSSLSWSKKPHPRPRLEPRALWTPRLKCVLAKDGNSGAEFRGENHHRRTGKRCAAQFSRAVWIRKLMARTWDGWSRFLAAASVELLEKFVGNRTERGKRKRFLHPLSFSLDSGNGGKFSI